MITYFQPIKHSVRTQKNILIIIFLSTQFVNCHTDKANNKYDTALIYSLNYYNIVTPLLWKNEQMLTQKVDNAFQTGDTYFGGYYAYKKTINDTMSSLYFEFYFNDKDTIFIPGHHYKRYISDNWQHILSFDRGGDTLYHYKAELFGSMKKFFISGEYSYKYEFCGMNSDERLYYEHHKDSLKRIKGMNLPPLTGTLDTLKKIK